MLQSRQCSLTRLTRHGIVLDENETWLSEE